MTLRAGRDVYRSRLFGGREVGFRGKGYLFGAAGRGLCTAVGRP